MSFWLVALSVSRMDVLGFKIEFERCHAGQGQFHEKRNTIFIIHHTRRSPTSQVGKGCVAKTLPSIYLTPRATSFRACASEVAMVTGPMSRCLK